MDTAAGDDAPNPLEEAGKLSRKLPGYRVEIIGGEITVTPPADGRRGNALTDVVVPLLAAGLHGKEARVIQAVGVWLPDGPFDYAVPDLAVVDADFAEHNRCDPAVFRTALEVTSSNYGDDPKKPAAYAFAGIPVYVIADRRVHVLTESGHGEYRVHAVHPPGEFLHPARIRGGGGDAGGGRGARAGLTPKGVAAGEPMGELLAALRRAGAERVHPGMPTANTGARRFYDRLGFHELKVPGPGPLTCLGRATGELPHRRDRPETGSA